MPNRRVLLQGPAAEHTLLYRSASKFALPSPRIPFTKFSTPEFPCRAQPKKVRVGILEVDDSYIAVKALTTSLKLHPYRRSGINQNEQIWMMDSAAMRQCAVFVMQKLIDVLPRLLHADLEARRSSIRASSNTLRANPASPRRGKRCRIQQLGPKGC